MLSPGDGHWYCLYQYRGGEANGREGRREEEEPRLREPWSRCVVLLYRARVKLELLSLWQAQVGIDVVVLPVGSKDRMLQAGILMIACLRERCPSHTAYSPSPNITYSSIETVLPIRQEVGDLRKQIYTIKACILAIATVGHASSGIGQSLTVSKGSSEYRYQSLVHYMPGRSNSRFIETCHIWALKAATPSSPEHGEALARLLSPSY